MFVLDHSRMDQCQSTEKDAAKLIQSACDMFWKVISASQVEIETVHSAYIHCDPLMQTGPTYVQSCHPSTCSNDTLSHERCGLVALIMALRIVIPELHLELNQVLERAKSQKITMFGEMFSGKSV